MHYAYQDFGNTQDDDAVISQLVKCNSKFYRQDINLNDTIIERKIIKEGSGLSLKATHAPHMGNMYKTDKVVKLIAVHILSSRDNIQGGEFTFGKWGDPIRKDNYGKIVESKNPYPTWLNEQGSLFIIPAMEHMGTQLIVSGELEYVLYSFRGANFK